MNYDSDLEVSNAHLHSTYQRSFSDNLGWGWHWYRSSLRRKAAEATESDLALLLTFWALILTERTTARAGTGYVFALPPSITYHLSEGIALRVYLPGNFWCQFWCRRITGICAHCANTHQHTCACWPGDARPPTECFCQDVTNLRWTKFEYLI